MANERDAKMKAYHFTNETLRDGSPIPPAGEWLVHDGELELCVSGYHASVQPFDALQYAPGSKLHLVEVGGEILHGDDKLVARKRNIIASFDATDLLREFARQCALDVYHLWGDEKTDPSGVCKRYLETGDESLRDAAGDAAWAAAWDAARDAAWAAAAPAAWDAARDAASAAAEDAARDAARDAQRKRFNAMVKAEFERIREG